jgi:hypothetical protein
MLPTLVFILTFVIPYICAKDFNPGPMSFTAKMPSFTPQQTIVQATNSASSLLGWQLTGGLLDSRLLCRICIFGKDGTWNAQAINTTRVKEVGQHLIGEAAAPILM